MLATVLASDGRSPRSGLADMCAPLRSRDATAVRKEFHSPHATPIVVHTLDDRPHAAGLTHDKRKISLRILFCNYEYPPLGGGGGVVMAALARQLARRHEVTVLTSRALDLPSESIEGNVRVVRAPVFFRRHLAVANFPSMFAYLPSATLRGLRLRRPGFDVVNTHFVVPTGPVGHALAASYGVPHVLSVHGGDLYDPSKRSSPHRHGWLRTPIRWMLRGADEVVGQSRNTVDHVRDIYGVERDVKLIPLGIERPPTTAPASRADFNLPENAFVAVTIGRLVARKSTEQLVAALKNSALPNAHLLIVGDGPEAVTIRAAAAAAGLSDRVHLLGQVSDSEKYRALSIADAFISSSQHEGFGLVFLEAMAFGLPVLCYDHGGQTDFLKSGETGFVVKLNDLESFTRALIELHEHREQRLAMGAHNRKLVEAFFIDRCAAAYESIFESALRREPRVASAPVRKRTG
jgi:glycosyltransferase involved in cell wall biosynthesis